VVSEVAAGEWGLLDKLCGWTFEDDAATVSAGAGAGAEVDHPIGVGDDIEVVLDHDHRASAVDEAVEQPEQVAHVAGRARAPKSTCSTSPAAAIAIASDQGIQELTIRAVAMRLKVAPMSVYTYVPGKSELLMLMLDAVFAQMRCSRPADDSWRARVRALADDNHRLFRASLAG
jgi:hypothetical protein